MRSLLLQTVLMQREVRCLLKIWSDVNKGIKSIYPVDVSCVVLHYALRPSSSKQALKDDLQQRCQT